MITEITGNIFNQDVEALVNPVNCVGVMGSGLAKQFKERHPDYYDHYKIGCKLKRIKTGEIDVFIMYKKFIISFPTKYHWKEKSNLEDIACGLDQLKPFLKDDIIKSIAIPHLGCGLGGLDWESEVRPLIYSKLDGLKDIDIRLVGL